MKVSTRGRYGLRAMLDLAEHQNSAPIPLRKIAERQSISIQYLEQIFVALRRSGLVRSVRGAQGGYELDKEADDIYVGDIVEILEGPVAPVDCLVKDDNCQQQDDCITRDVWQMVQESIEDVLYSMTLNDLKNKKSLKLIKQNAENN